MIVKSNTSHLRAWLAFIFLGFGLAGQTQAETIINATSTSKSDIDSAMTVYKTATCGCCTTWVEHADKMGFNNTVKNLSYDDMTVVKNKLGIGNQFQSCHTAVNTDGYAFEGHVPSKYIKLFLASPPENAIGLAVPGMPVGSPGMEYQNKFMPYQIMLLMKDGSSSVYASIDNPEMQF